MQATAIQQEDLRRLSAEERIAWAVQRFPASTVASSSFGADSAVLLHLISRVAPRLPIVFLNTGFLFAETLGYKTHLEQLLSLNIREVGPALEREAFLDRHGPVFRSNPDFCCGCNKVEPMRRALEGVDCWIAGVRADQTAQRAGMSTLERQADGLHKLHPMLDWDAERIQEYAQRHRLPPHPLAAEGYRSIGCEPCTAKPEAGGDARSGRWAGQAKTECGIHYLFEPIHAATK